METLLRAWFIFAVLTLFAVPAAAVEAGVVGAGTAAEEQLQCTWPSTSLLSGNDLGGAVGTVNSFISGAVVYLQSAGRYVSCISVKMSNAALAFEQPIFRFVYHLTAPKPAQPPQQQPPAQ